MADVSLIDPYSSQQESIARRRRMAQALQQQAQTPLEMPQSPGVLISPYAGLAKVLQGLVGGYQEAEAAKEYKALGEEARTNQATDFAKVIGALKAPGQEAIVGQDAVDFVPGSYTPERTSLRNYAETTIPAEFTPTIPGRPAIAAQPAREAGYIGPDLIASLKDPSMRQFAMAQAMAKLEPKAPISVAAGGTLLDPRTLKPVFTADAAPQRGVAVGQGQELRNPITGALLATGPAKDAKATESKWEKGQKTVNGKTVYGWYDLTAANYKDSFREGAVPPAGNTKLVEVTRGGKVYYENPEIANVAERQAAAIEKEAVKTPTHYSEIEDKGNIVIVDMNLPANERLEKGQIKGPIRGNLKQIATNDAEGRPVTRWVDEGTLVALGDIPQQYTGLLLEMAQAGQLKKGWESDPRVAGVIRDNLINQSGGITPARLADIRVRIAEAAARLGDAGIAFDAKGLTPPLSNLTTLPSGSSATAAPAAAVGANDIKSKVEAGGLKYEPAKYDYRINADGSVYRKAK